MDSQIQRRFELGFPHVRNIGVCIKACCPDGFNWRTCRDFGYSSKKTRKDSASYFSRYLNQVLDLQIKSYTPTEFGDIQYVYLTTHRHEAGRYKPIYRNGDIVVDTVFKVPLDDHPDRWETVIPVFPYEYDNGNIDAMEEHVVNVLVKLHSTFGLSGKNVEFVVGFGSHSTAAIAFERGFYLFCKTASLEWRLYNLTSDKERKLSTQEKERGYHLSESIVSMINRERIEHNEVLGGNLNRLNDLESENAELRKEIEKMRRNHDDVPQSTNERINFEEIHGEQGEEE